jgi:hypothetical protein
MAKKLAVVTMVYNEPEYLPLWCRYYSGQTGPQHCYIIDHSTFDGSTDRLVGFNVVRVPRSTMDDIKRARFVSQFCSALLEWYDAVIYVDVDEIVIAEPNKFSSLREYIETQGESVVNAIGFDVQHLPVIESRLNLDLPILAQRKWVRFSSSMCKPILTTRALTWTPGFHSADAPLRFNDLYLFHLRYFDLAIGLERLHRTRAMDWSSESAGRHQRVNDVEFRDLVTKVADLPRVQRPSFSPETPPIATYLQRVYDSEKPFGAGTYNLDLHIFGEELLELPEIFRRCL